MDEQREVAWNECPVCMQHVGDDMRTGEYRDSSNCTCVGCGVTYVATAFDDGSWGLVPPDPEDAPDSEPWERTLEITFEVTGG